MLYTVHGHKEVDGRTVAGDGVEIMASDRAAAREAFLAQKGEGWVVDKVVEG